MLEFMGCLRISCGSGIGEYMDGISEFFRWLWGLLLCGKWNLQF